MDLSKILKGHEGEIFWSDLFGCIILEAIEEDNTLTFSLKSNRTELISCDYDGKLLDIPISPDLQISTISPSIENRDWEKWAKEHLAVEQPKVGQYFTLANVSRYQIINIDDKDTTVVNISSGITVTIKNREFKDKINSKKIKLVDNIEDILKPFDKVLIQFREGGPWRLDFYSNFDGSNAHCINHCVTKEHILPYYPNKHLFNNGEK